jgi:hypothetical protein
MGFVTRNAIAAINSAIGVDVFIMAADCGIFLFL